MNTGMGEAQELPELIIDEEAKDGIRISSKTPIIIDHQPPMTSNSTRYKWWLRIVVFTTFVLSGQSIATLLGRLYFDKGGNSKWMATLVQTVGFPVLLPFLFLYPTKQHTPETNHIDDHDHKKPSISILVSLYLFLGILLAADCMLYTIGLAYLPVSTYSLICASQLAFNALFSYFLNAQKFTPFIVNSLVLLTVSSTLLVFQNDQQEQSTTTSKKKYTIGFISTVGASAAYGFMLSITQLAFRKILKTQTFRVVLDVIIYQSMIATFAILIGLFASSEWKTINGEMEGYKLGKVSYVMNLVWTAVSWQVFSIGVVGLIFEVSSLFSNVISTLGLPIVPVFAVVFFHDRMNGVKVVAMLLAVWGFISYIYQHYIDDLKSKAEAKNTVIEVSLTKEVS